MNEDLTHIASCCAACLTWLPEGHGIVRKHKGEYTVCTVKESAPCPNCNEDTILRNGRVECHVTVEDYNKIKELAG